MRLIFIVSFLLLSNYELVASNDEDKEELFKNSILIDLKNKNGSFFADIELVDIDGQAVNHVEEKYSYGLKIGEYVGQEKFESEDKKRFTAKLIYLNDINEIYQIDKDRRICKPEKLEPIIGFFMTSWAPNDVFIEKKQYTIIGPNVLLEVFLENREKMKCEFKDEVHKCTIDFKETQLEYHFGKRGTITMYPIKIILKQQDSSNGGWKATKQINYFKFTPHWRPSVIVSSDLPIGYGCSRLNKGGFIPIPKTKYGESFELDYEVVFRYVDTNATKNFNPGPLYWSSDDEEDKKNNEEKKKKFLTRIFFNRMYQNDLYSTNVVESVNEKTKANTRTIYDLNTNVVYDILMEEDKCQSYHLNPNHKINYFYVQDLFLHQPEFFRTDDGFHYLGQYNVRNVPTMVFERTISQFNPTNLEKTHRSKNQVYIDFILENMNGIESDHAIVTHYYPTVNDFFGKDYEHLKVPMKIEIRLFSNEERIEEIAKLTINVASFRRYDENKHKLYDVSKCATHEYDYNWFLVQFDDTPDAVKKYRRFESQIKDSFIQLLQLSPFRFGEVIVDSDENSLYITAKLMELAQVEGYFRSEEGKTIQNPTGEETYADTEELCARRCFSNKNCGAYAYCGKLDCKLWTDEKFDEEFDPKNKKEYDWNKLNRTSEEDCVLGTRFVKYNKNAHISNREFLENLDELISKKSLETLGVVNEKSEIEPFTATKLQVNVQPGRHTKSSSNFNDEKLDDERNHIKYNDLFTIVKSGEVFNHRIVKEDQEKKKENVRLVGANNQMYLWECQLMCINNNDCQSLSYCSDSNECVLTSLNTTQDIENYTTKNHKCSTSIKNYLAGYHKHNQRGIVDGYEKKIDYKDVTPEICSSICSNDEKCLSFDVCREEIEGSEKEKLVCYLHNVHSSQNKGKDDKKKDKDEDKKSKLGLKKHCDHYTYKHSLEFNEYTAAKLKEPDMGSHLQISLENCASLCITSEDGCNSFDYCLEKEEKGGHLKTTHCHLSRSVYSSEVVEAKQFDCSTYSRIKPFLLTKTVDKYVDGPIHGGWVTFLSFLFLCVGVAAGAGIAYYVIKNYIVPY